MTKRTYARVALLAPLVASSLALAGCMGSPTYGTDKTAGEQLAGDISGAFSITPKRGANIDYKPRPELVKPAPGQKEVLPAPQQSIETASTDWPESPEQRRARLRADATAHQDDPNYKPQIVDDMSADPAAEKNAQTIPDHRPTPGAVSAAESNGGRAAEIQRRVREGKQGDPTTRKYLSEPPLAYRAAADTAPQGDLGEDEYRKERRLKKEAAAKSKTGGLFDWLPSW
jgi:hypothetical protein